MKPDKCASKLSVPWLVRGVFLAGVAASLLLLLFAGVRSSRHFTIQLDSRGTPRFYGLPLTNAKVRNFVYRAMSLLKPTEVRLSVPSTAPVKSLIDAIGDLQAAGFGPSVKLMMEKQQQPSAPRNLYR